MFKTMAMLMHKSKVRYGIIVLIGLSIALYGCQSVEESGQSLTSATAEMDPESQRSDSAEPAEPTASGYRNMPSNAEWEPVLQEFDSVVMAKVPAGCFKMGDPKLARAQPVHEVCLTESYWIDVTEVSNEQFERFGGQAAHEVRFPGQEVSGDVLPRTSVTWEEADEFCQLRGGWLPTEAEWEFAARGPDGYTYPWGNQLEADKLNYCGQSCPIHQSTGGQYFTSDDGYEVAAPVNSMPEGVSWVGALHMAGNAAEWVADWYDADYYAASPIENPRGPETGLHRVVKSAPWSWYEDIEMNFQVANRWDFIPDSTSKDYSATTGFRCLRAGS